MVISGGNFRPDTLKPKEVVSLLLDDDEMERKRKFFHLYIVRDGQIDQLQFEFRTVNSVILVHYAVTNACFW